MSTSSSFLFIRSYVAVFEGISSKSSLPPIQQYTSLHLFHNSMATLHQVLTGDEKTKSSSQERLTMIYTKPRSSCMNLFDRPQHASRKWGFRRTRLTAFYWIAWIRLGRLSSTMAHMWSSRNWVRKEALSGYKESICCTLSGLCESSWLWYDPLNSMIYLWY